MLLRDAAQALGWQLDPSNLAYHQPKPDRWWHSDSTWIDMSDIVYAYRSQYGETEYKLRGAKSVSKVFDDAESFWQAWLKYREGGGA